MLWEDSCPKKFQDYHSQLKLVGNLKNLSNTIKDGGIFPNKIS